MALFPYLDGEVKNRFVFEGTWKDSSEDEYNGVTTSRFAYHMNQIPFTIKTYTETVITETKMLFVGGLLGVVAELDNSVLPIFGYAVMENKAVKEIGNQYLK